MHVLAFEQVPDNRRGGQERSLFEMCEGLSDKNVDVSLVYRREGNLLPDYQNFCRTTIHVPQRYQYAPSETPGFLTSLIRLSWHSLHTDWDVIYTNQYHNLPITVLLGKTIRRPVVCHLRLPAPPYISRRYRWGLEQCKRIIPISKHTAATYADRDISTDPMRIIYNGIDPEHFVPQDPDDASFRWILYLGRITPDKGLDTLLEAYGRVAQTRPDVGLRIVGGETDTQSPAEYRSELQRKAKKLDGTVEFIPHVEDVRPLLRNADLLTLPSEWGEPFGRVLIEAMSSGIPVVAARDGGIPEVLEPDYTDHLFPPGNVNQLANRFHQFIDWRDKVPSLGPDMRKYVQEHFTVDRTVDELKEVLLESIQE